MESLNAAMFVAMDQDEVVFPRESQIFGELTKPDEQGHRKALKMEETELYQKDYLGLKYLSEHGKLKQVHVDGKHVAVKDADIDKHLVPFLKT